MDFAEIERPRKRQRTERGKRSKQGCQTCLRKKVKCDEHHPVCGRCARLVLDCEWSTEPIPSLSARRRGYGPIKERHNWTPKFISSATAAAHELQQQDEGSFATERDSDVSGIVDLNDNEVSQEYQYSNFQMFESTPSIVQLQDSQKFHMSTVTMLPPAVTEQVDDPLCSDATGQLVNLSHIVTDGAWDLCEQDEPLDHLQTSFNDKNLPGMPHVWPPNIWHPVNSWTTLDFPIIDGIASTAVESSDLSAMSFHRVVFALLKAPGASSGSAHSIFLDRALSSNMAMHFLLAFSHSELAIYQGQGAQIPQRSWLHFNHGSRLLFRQVYPDAPRTDHVTMLISFLYMYMFWMRRDPFNHSMLRELSRSVLYYVKTHGLDDSCANPRSLGSDQILLCRILTYIYDRDGFCYFYGCGGDFASYVNENPDKRRRIWRLSRRNFPWAIPHGRLDNLSSLAGKTERTDARVTEIYFQLISIHHDINCYSQAPSGSQTTTLGRRIEEGLTRVENENELLNTVLNHKQNSISRPPSLMALVTVTFYHALLIYFYRCEDSHFAALPVPPRVGEALSALMKTAYYTVYTGPVQFLERFQWALLIAGIESQDPIHQEWIGKNLTDPAIQSARRSITNDMLLRGGTISMKRIRQLVSSITLSNDEDRTS